MIGGRARGSSHLHFAPRRQRRVPVRLLVVGLVVVVVLIVAGLVKAAAATVPDPRVSPLMAPEVVLPGPAPKPAWPATGEAAVEVQGLPPLGSSGPAAPVPIASLAKIMTAYVVLLDHPLVGPAGGFSVAVTAADVTDYEQRQATAQSVVAVATGETITERQLLEGLLVPSGNNLAAILAVHDAGSVGAFVARMNTTARSLGMLHTTYTDPSGLLASTVSTAGDQLLLAGRAMADPAFASIVAMTSVTLPVAGILANFNSAVGTDGYIGIKTGSDSTAGGCLVFANRRSVDGRPYTVIGAVLGQDIGHQSTRALIAAAVSASTALVQSIVGAVAVRTVVPAGTPAAVVTNAAGRRVVAATSEPLNEVAYGGMTVGVSVATSAVGRTVTAGQRVAEVVLTGGSPGGPATRSTPATARTTMPGVSFAWKLRHFY
jgi:D-alanyl-D-alanine carboxypeptidase (penicillin-binding protein 5/6)